jgi:hypothetical protein
MTVDADMTQRSNALFSAIVATVAANSPRTLTVAEIAQRLSVNVDVAANCIALHRHFLLQPLTEEGLQETALDFPPPPDFTVPAPDEIIDEAALGLKSYRARPGSER